MSILRAILGELLHESRGTIAILERVPADQLEWAPHPKSMSLGRLAAHIATLPAGCRRMLEAGRFEIGGARPPAPLAAPPAEVYRNNVDELTEHLRALSESALAEPFAMVRGDEVLREMTKGIMLRTIFLNHSVHHRGQLSVYLRLLDVPLPALYGTSADENPFA